MTIARTCAVALVLLASCGKPDTNGSNAPVDTPRANGIPDRVRAPWFTQTLIRDLTDDGVADSAVLTATGDRPDSSDVRLTLFVDGRPAHEEEWNTSYELIDRADSLRTASDQMRFLRARFADVLSGFKLSPLDIDRLAVVRDTVEVRTQLDSIVPLPKRQLDLSYGYETSMALVWDASRHRFVPIFICC